MVRDKRVDIEKLSNLVETYIPFFGIDLVKKNSQEFISMNRKKKNRLVIVYIK